MKINFTAILIIVVTLVAAGGAYWIFFTGTGNEASLTASTSNNETEMQYQALADQLQSISFKTDIFDDPRFNALTDLTTPVIPESIGRMDPFAPIPGG